MSWMQRFRKRRANPANAQATPQALGLTMTLAVVDHYERLREELEEHPLSGEESALLCAELFAYWFWLFSATVIAKIESDALRAAYSGEVLRHARETIASETELPETLRRAVQDNDIFDEAFTYYSDDETTPGDASRLERIRALCCSGRESDLIASVVKLQNRVGGVFGIPIEDFDFGLLWLANMAVVTAAAKELLPDIHPVMS